ncbi:MAG: DUF1573 domain-containing protein [Bacteroidales bacterium]|jgi:hypothetical protein
MRKIILTICIVLFAVFTIKAGGNEPNPQNDSTFAQLTFQTTIHDYGQVVKTESNNAPAGDYTFTFTNTGTKPLTIDSIKTSPDYVTVTWTNTPVSPNSTGTITVNYNTTALGIINKQIDIFSNAINSPVVLTIVGNVTD